MKAMTKHATVLATTAALMLFVGTAQAESIGFVAEAVGDVQVQRIGTSSWEAAFTDFSIEVGDTIKTDLDSRAKVILVDDTTLNIDEDTEIRIDSLHVGAAATRDRSIIRQTKGRVRTIVGEAFGGSTRIEVHTPTAVVGVKGTDFESTLEQQARKKRLLVCLHDGKIVVRSTQGLGERDPKPGNCVYFYGDQPPSEEFLNPQVPFSVASSAPPFRAPDFIETPDVALDGGNDTDFFTDDGGDFDGGGRDGNLDDGDFEDSSTNMDDMPDDMMDEPDMPVDEPDLFDTVPEQK